MPSKKKEDQNKWISAHHDPVAGIYTFTQCCCFSDINADGDNKLLIADLGTGIKGMKLKVFKGTNLVSENTIIDLPTAITTFYMDHVEPRTPAIAVASGPFIYVYKNLRPYFKFTLPPLDVDAREQALWDQAKEGSFSVGMLREKLDDLHVNDGVLLTVRSLRIMQLGPHEAAAFMEQYASTPLKRQTVITCMSTLKKSHSEDDSISCLVLGTENKQVYFLDPEAFTILSSVSLKSAPVFLSVSGLYDVEFRVVCACRSGAVFNIKRADTEGRLCFELSSQPVGLVRVAKNIVVACMDDTLQCYTFKGKRLWQVKLPSYPTAIQLMDNVQKNYKAVIVALGNKEVVVYRDKYLVDTIPCEDTVSAICYGRFGREDNSLVLVMKGGALNIKMLKRTADLSESSGSHGPPAAQAKKLDIPKKTKLFVDQTLRERESAVSMHRQFQHDLYRLRLRAARGYSHALTTSNSPISANPHEPIKLNAQVQGIGPTFKMYVQLQNTSMNQPSLDLLITFAYDESMYEIQKRTIEVPMIVPGVHYSFDTLIVCKSTKSISDNIKVFVMKKAQSVPLITAVISMPVSENVIVV